MNDFRIDTKKKSLKYNLLFKYLGEVIELDVNLVKLQDEDLIINGATEDFIAQLVLLPSGVFGVRVLTIAGKNVIAFPLPQLDIKVISND